MQNKIGMRINLICEYCRQVYQVQPYRANRSRFCSAKCKGKWTGENIWRPRWLGKSAEEIWGKDIAQVNKKRVSNMSKNRLGQLNPFFGHLHTEKTKRENALAHKGKLPWNKGLTTEDDRLLQALRACHKKPNRKEQILIELLERNNLPFKYTGDGSFVIGGYIPDFVNCNGDKQIIEFFGDYWHNKADIPWHQTELGRIMAYSQFGYKTLIVWEHELKDTDSLIFKIRKFF